MCVKVIILCFQPFCTINVLLDIGCLLFLPVLFDFNEIWPTEKYQFFLLSYSPLKFVKRLLLLHLNRLTDFLDTY